MKCKDSIMKNVIDKKCINCGEHQPIFNYKGLKPEYCKSCCLEEMVDVCHDNEMCKCGKRASYNLPGLKPIYCSECKNEGMINVVCILCECVKFPNFNFSGLRPKYCNKCKSDDMINISKKKCISSWCESNGSTLYNGYCYYCNQKLNPNDPRIKNYKTKEKIFVDSVLDNFSNYDFIHDREISGGCSRKRPDLFLDLLSHVIIIEVDEFGHSTYDSILEKKRIIQIHNDIANRPMIVIRINTDSYVKDGKRQKSCFRLNKITGLLMVSDRNELNKRLKSLKEKIVYWLTNVPSGIKYEYLYYS